VFFPKHYSGEQVKKRRGGACKVLVGGGNLKERYVVEDLSIGGRIILKYILEKYYGRVWVGLSFLRIERSGQLV
jgi:hypothetical protein